MEFNEPDLEDLIQSDLHSEMNKILDQSDVPSVEANTSVTCKLEKNISPMTEEQTEEIKVPLQNEGTTPCTKENIGQIKFEQDHDNPSELFLESGASISDPTTTAGTQHPRFSGQFSLEHLPTTSIITSSNGENTCVKSEQNDLSNLAWLTSVDVQQALQRSEVSLPESEPASFVMENSCRTPSCLAEVMTGQSNSMAFPVAINHPQSTMPCPPEARQTTRFTPIQPNLTMEGHQRYVLQQATTGQRTLLPITDQMGGHGYPTPGRYHPYPPPPYGSPGASYGLEPYQHGRYQNQAPKIFPKPVYSYSCLIAMSLRASKTGCLPVSDIYNFMMENFPYFKTAPDGWKNSVRHNLSLNKCFEKVEKPNGSQRKGCLWALNPAKVSKMEEEVQKWKRKDPDAIRKSMSNPEEFDREMEDIRRADEEATRRRMLSMTTHGLSMTPVSYHPYSRHGRQHPNPSLRHVHPSGTASLPTTPQHYHHRAPHGQGMMGHGLTPTHPGFHVMRDEHNHPRPPRQLFTYPPEQHAFPLGSPGITSTPSSMKCGNQVLVGGESNLNCPILPSSFSSSSSSGNTSSFGALAESMIPSCHDLNDIDLDSSLADLSALQGTGWDDGGSGIGANAIAGDIQIDAFDENPVQSLHPHPRMDSSSSMSTIEQVVTSADANPDPDVFGTATRFGGDLAHFSNNKTVMLH